MEWVETTGRTVEEAKDAALDRLGVDEEDAEFEIVEEPKVGLFGRLRAEARVRARVRPTTPRPKEDRRDRRRRRPASDAGAVTTTRDETTAEGGLAEADVAPTAGGERRAGAGARGAGRGTTSGTAVAGAEGDADADLGVVATTGPARSRAPRRGRSDRPGDAGIRSARESEREPGPDLGAESDEGAGMDVSLEEQGEVAAAFLDGLATSMELQAEIQVVQPEEGIVEVNMEGSDLGILIGPKGATLLALQDLTRTVVQRRTGASNGRLFVDVGSYRQKRKAALERFARQVAAEVVASGTRKVLEPMSAADRKVVHDAVNDIEGVRTTSEGEEPQRRVIILPFSE